MAVQTLFADSGLVRTNRFQLVTGAAKLFKDGDATLGVLLNVLLVDLPGGVHRSDE